MASYVHPTFGINFSIIEPGGISSEFANSVLTQLEKTGGMPQDDYLPVLQQYISNAQSRAVSNGSYESADEVASKVIEVVTSDNPPIRVRTSDWAENFAKLKTQSDPDGKKVQQQIVETIL